MEKPKGSPIERAARLALAVVPKKTTLPVLGCVRLAFALGHATIEATDLERNAFVSVGYEGPPIGPICVNAKAFADAVRGATSVSFEVVKTDAGEALRVTRPTGDVEIPITSADEFPVTPTVGEYVGKATVGADPLRWVALATSTDVTRYSLLGVHVREGWIEATDGHRMHRYPAAVEKVNTIVPTAAVSCLAHMADMLGGRIGLEFFRTFATGFDGKPEPRANVRAAAILPDLSVSFSARCIDGKFPNCDQVIPRDGDTPVYVELPAADLIAALRQGIKAVSTNDLPPVVVSLNGKTVLAMSSPDRGRWTSSLAYKATGEVSLNVNPAYLADAFSHLADKATLATAAGAEAKARPMRVDRPDGSLAVVMPMRS